MADDASDLNDALFEQVQAQGTQLDLISEQLEAMRSVLETQASIIVSTEKRARVLSLVNTALLAIVLNQGSRDAVRNWGLGLTDDGSPDAETVEMVEAMTRERPDSPTTPQGSGRRLLVIPGGKE